MPHPLIPKLRTLAQVVRSSVRNINGGGCAVFASLVGQRLESMGLDVEIVSSWDEHYAVRLKLPNGKVFTYDANKLRRSETEFGEYVDFDMDRVSPYVAGPWGTGLSVEACSELAANADHWNPLFDRQSIPVLERLVREHLS